MRVAVFGLGYVGTVCGACLAYQGHEVKGVDVQPTKVQLINEGVAPMVEPGLQDILVEVVESGKFSATTDVVEGLVDAEVVLVCVGTPASDDGSPQLKYVENVVRQIGENLSVASDFPVIAIRSTVPPGSLQVCSEILSDASGRTPGHGFGVVANPEFLREGSALADFMDPAYTLIGTAHSKAVQPIRDLYGFLDAPVVMTEPGPAELIKYVNNSFHALKIAFANEIGNISKAFGIDSHQVMDLVCSDTKLNISPAYLKPGFAYGGSCLPKDLHALNEMAESNGLEVPLLGSVSKSNDVHLARSIELLREQGTRRLGFLGLSFKAQTDDLRESPAVKIVDALLDEDYEIRIYDPNVNLARLTGANKAYIETHFSHIEELLVTSPDELLDFAEALVVTNNESSYYEILSKVNGHHKIVDMARIPDSPKLSEGCYHGICW